MTRGLTITEIASGMVACRANARELLDESDILLRTNHQARAFALGHTAIEELAKFFILELAGKRVAQNNPPNWKRFWKRLRNHDSKIAQTYLRIMQTVPADLIETNHFASAMAGAEMLFKTGLVPRNAGLYVELSPEGGFRQPSTIDWSVGLEALRSVAVSLLRMADGAGLSSDAIEKALRMPAQAGDQVLTGALAIAVLERCREAGISEEQVRKIINRSYARS